MTSTRQQWAPWLRWLFCLLLPLCLTDKRQECSSPQEASYAGVVAAMAAVEAMTRPEDSDGFEASCPEDKTILDGTNSNKNKYRKKIGDDGGEKLPTLAQRKKLGKLYIQDERQGLMEASRQFGEEQVVPEGPFALSTVLVLRQSVVYMTKFFLNSAPTHALPRTLTCENKFDRCTLWAAMGRCESHMAWMFTNCGPACRLCHLLDFETRCSKMPFSKNALEPGQLHRLFQNLSKAMTDPYAVAVHSGPKKHGNNVPPSKGEGPWIVSLDGFLSPRDCQDLIQLAQRVGFERSGTAGKTTLSQDGSLAARQTKARTSETAWCTEQAGCQTDALIQRLMQRISVLTGGIPTSHFENVQFLRYSEGQYYQAHHDYLPHQRDRSCGPRILTLMIYLNSVREGGETVFGSMVPPLTMVPEAGRALLWPSVLDSDPTRMDPRTQHEARKVAGVKYVANVWIHLRDFQTPLAMRCT